MIGMRDLLNKTFSFLILLILAGNITLHVEPANAVSLEQPRQQFLQAKKFLRAKKVKSFKRLAIKLKHYPLYPYLLHDYLRPRLWKVKDKEIISFLRRYGDLPMANDLRQAWLKYLAKRGRWQIYVDNYTPQDDTTLQCYHLKARFKTGNHTYLLEDTRSLWLSGESLPSQCDLVFKRLEKSELMTSELVWERIRLSMANGDSSLTKYLSRHLNKTDKKWVARWIATHHNPSRWTRRPKYQDIPIAREILIHGINRLTRVDIDKAISRWDRLESSYNFLPDDKKKIERNIAVRAAKQKHDKARELIDQIESSLVDDEIFHWRLYTALQQNDWPRLLKWTTDEPPEESIRLRWLYWRARALEETGDRTAAVEIFKTVAEERDYYGFLAADRIGFKYKLNHHTLPEDLETWQQISEKPAVVRARELYLLGMTYSARREWHHAFHDMTSYQMQIAAAIAANWGWHDRTILTLGQAKAYDDLFLRFPLPFEKQLRANAKRYDLDLAWVYALVRAESIFMDDARSPAGALGLMQIMPRTGRETAKKIGWKRFRTSQLLQYDKNIRLGTTYLKQMYDKFNGNIVLATAAYNAGPHRVTKWLPIKECIEPDIWIEKILFKETRKYVRRILYYASVYDWRLQQDIKPVQQRMAAVQPENMNLVASLSCNAPMVSMQ